MHCDNMEAVFFFFLAIILSVGTPSGALSKKRCRVTRSCLFVSVVIVITGAFWWLRVFLHLRLLYAAARHTRVFTVRFTLLWHSFTFRTACSDAAKHIGRHWIFTHLSSTAWIERGLEIEKWCPSIQKEQWLNSEISDCYKDWIMGRGVHQAW